MLRNFLRRSRDNYYLSKLLLLGAKPAHAISARLAGEIERIVRTNGVKVRLPNGGTLRIARDSGINMASHLYWHGLEGYEPHTSKSLRFFFERCSTFVDVGANYGYYSLLAALWNENLKVISFEPVPRIYEGLLRNLAANFPGSRVQTFPTALSDRSGKATFFLPKGADSDAESTGTLVSDGWQSRKGAPSMEVETMSFDDFETTHPMKVDLVKIDVEDFEAAVLHGMQDTIRRDRPFIVCEILPRDHKNEETRKLIEDLGYTPYWITAGGSYVRVADFDFPRETCDFLLSPVTAKTSILSDLSELWKLKQV
jgi:FkbM family methyltransferase